MQTLILHEHWVLALPGLIFGSYTRTLILQSVLKKTTLKADGYFAYFRMYNQALHHSKKKKQRLPVPARQPNTKLHTKDTWTQA